jgi:hypothetical protein
MKKNWEKINLEHIDFLLDFSLLICWPLFFRLSSLRWQKIKWKYYSYGYLFFFLMMVIVATLALGSWPRQRLARVRAKTKLGSHISCSWECKRVWGNEPSHSRRHSHFRNLSPDGVPVDSQIFRERLQGSKLIGLRCPLYYWKDFGT